MVEKKRTIYNYHCMFCTDPTYCEKGCKVYKDRTSSPRKVRKMQKKKLLKGE